MSLDFDLIKQTWDEEDEIERISLEFMEPLIAGWKMINASPSIPNASIASFHVVTEESLRFCWGDEARLDFGENTIIFIHPSGDYRIERKLI